MGESSDVTFRVRTVTPVELEGKAEDLDIRFEDQVGNLDPVTGFIIVGGALAGGAFLIRLWREFQGGTVIDLTKTPVDISRNRALDYGFFVVIAKDGSVTVEPKDEPETALERMATAVLKLSSDAAAEVIKATVEGALSGKANVELKPA
jgi:hypothetical protein